MKEIVDPLLKWYQKNKRMLPWRKDNDPYHVWISEVMLQQTQIETVIPYYERFIATLPNIESLKNVEDDVLLKLWEGLGYYNRARNLKKAATVIVDKYQGTFPKNWENIKSLPGIGEYTASAISSICFFKKEVCIDGNVLRVYQRLTNSKKNIRKPSVQKEIRNQLMKIIPPDSSSFNQALMELGEVICLPKQMPKCNLCPLNFCCQAKEKGTFLEIPISKESKPKKIEKKTVLILICKEKIALHRRKEENLLKDLWEFPNIEGNLTKEEVEQYFLNSSISISKISPSCSYTHTFSHLKWQMKSYFVEIEESLSQYHWVEKEELLKNYPMPTAFQPFRKELEKF